MFIPFFGTKIINGVHFTLLKRTWVHWNVLETIKDVQITSLRRLLHEGKTNECKHFIPFLEVIKTRQKQAKQSILVQVQSIKSYKELQIYCSQYGAIKEMFHYKAGKEPLHFILVEFQKETSVKQVLKDCEHIQDSQIVPVESTFVWFRASKNNFLKKQSKSQIALTIENGNCILPEKDLKTKLQACDSISEQIEMLYESTKLNDLGARLRFLSARQIEVALSGIFPSAVAFPFGSCVNGFGKMNCDLDVVLKLAKDKISDDNRLIYHCKASGTSERLTSQRHMETIADLIHLFLPGCSQVRKILQARVPIIKYYQQLTDVECDLSMGNMSGVYMSDLLHIWGSADARVRPLVFVVRKWAEEVGLTNNFPGRWITNFSLTLLVLAFLQKPKDSPPILPPLNTLVKLAGSNDKYIAEDGTDCSFLRDIRKLKFRTENYENLESLLLQFFEYYSTFDFERKAICLNQAMPITKPEHSALYIVNPLERGLNVSKNVSPEELERLKLEMRNALWAIQLKEKKTDGWGILSLFENRGRQFPSVLGGISIKSQNHTRLMDVSKLFEEENVDTELKESMSLRTDAEGKIEGFTAAKVGEVKTRTPENVTDNNTNEVLLNVNQKRGS